MVICQDQGFSRENTEQMFLTHFCLEMGDVKPENL